MTIRSQDHLVNPIEIQADCYGMIRANMTIDEMVNLRIALSKPRNKDEIRSIEKNWLVLYQPV